MGFLLLTRITRFCDPLETRRVLLRVSADGEITEQASEVLERDPDACIVF